MSRKLLFEILFGSFFIYVLLNRISISKLLLRNQGFLYNYKKMKEQLSEAERIKFKKVNRRMSIAFPVFFILMIIIALIT